MLLAVLAVAWVHLVTARFDIISFLIMMIMMMMMIPMTRSDLPNHTEVSVTVLVDPDWLEHSQEASVEEVDLMIMMIMVTIHNTLLYPR